MTIHDPERTRVDPREVVARAICVASKPKPLTAGMDAWDLLISWAQVEPGGDLGQLSDIVGHAIRERAAFLESADPILAALTSAGFLNDQYFDAVKAAEPTNGKSQ